MTPQVCSSESVENVYSEWFEQVNILHDVVKTNLQSIHLEMYKIYFACLFVCDR